MGRKRVAETVEQTGVRYRRADRAGKGRILDEFCRQHGYERKYAIRLLGRRRGMKKTGRDPSGPGRGRPRTYGPAETRVLRKIWLAAEQPCSRRLKALLALWLPRFVARHGPLASDVRRRLLEMSPATIDRLLAPYRAGMAPRRRAARPGNLPRTQIPVRTHWRDVERQPGWIEADTVSHGGDCTRGDYVWSLTLTDIFSGWTEIRAVWNRGAEGVVRAITDIENALVFPLLGFDSDNGPEFLNHHLIAYLARPRGWAIKQTRSRPRVSNDNAHVEQKQWTHVRQLLGYDRLDDPALVGAINALYRPWGLLHNYFLPTMKLMEVRREGARRIRIYENEPQTPCQRLLDCPHLEPAAKDRLRRTLEGLDPFALHAEIQRLLKRIAELRRRIGPPDDAGPDAPRNDEFIASQVARCAADRAQSQRPDS